MTISKPKIFRLHKPTYISPGVYTTERDYNNVQLLVDFLLIIDGEVWFVKSTIPRLRTDNRFLMLPLNVEFWECLASNGNALLSWVNREFQMDPTLFKKQIELRIPNSNRSYVLYGCQLVESVVNDDFDLNSNMEPLVESTIIFDYFMENRTQ